MQLTQQLLALARNRLDLAYFNISPQWLVGFIEAEGSFYGKKGEQPLFHLSQHASDKFLMEAIAKFLGHGRVRSFVRKDGRSESILAIYNKEVLRNVIIPLCRGNLISINKSNQFNKWVETHFEDLAQPCAPTNLRIDKDWLVGFTDGDGSFYPMLHKAKDYRCGYQVQATFDLAQLDTDRQLLDSIGTQFFNGAYKWAKSGNTQHMRILKLETHLLYVEPFFDANLLQTRKRFDFLIWQEILSLMKNKGHLTVDGISIIKELQALQVLLRSTPPIEIEGALVK
jgi:hypothetical protein